MPEYIEREAVCSKCKNKSHCEVSFDEKQKCPVYKAPTADVAEVKHGEWIQTEEPLGCRDVPCVECSVCRESWIIEEDLCLEDYIESWRYCPNCGAKMDGKGG